MKDMNPTTKVTIAGDQLRVLFVSNLFPNLLEPARGIFNLHQVRHLSKICQVKVVAPIAWFFIKGKFAPPKTVPTKEVIDGLPVYHPKAFYLPLIGRSLNPQLFAYSLARLLTQIRQEFAFDVIFVDWAYPDGCGVAKLAQHLHIPFVASFAGSDANVYLNYYIRRRQILQMTRQASAVTVRSHALKNVLLQHGVADRKIRILYNGVDSARYNPVPRIEARRRLAIDINEKVLVYVGRLSPEKGVSELLAALALLRARQQTRVRLLIVGDGHQREALQQQTAMLHLADSVVWLGWRAPSQIGELISAGDILCLPSHMEGVPNAALEAFACGLPVVATNVGGLPEVVTERTGVLAEPNNPESFASALTRALQTSWDAEAIRQHATRFDWNENATQLLQILMAAAIREP